MASGRLKIEHQTPFDCGVNFFTKKTEYVSLPLHGQNLKAVRVEDQIMLVMDDDFAKLISDETKDGCSNAEAIYEALREVGIGQANYSVDLEVNLSQIVTISVEDCDDEDEAYEKAKDILSGQLRDYIDISSLFEYGVSEIFEYDITEE